MSTSWASHSYDLVHQNLLNQEESKVNPQEHLPMETSENTQIEAVEGFVGSRSPSKEAQGPHT
jgi:hypothetical protein